MVWLACVAGACVVATRRLLINLFRMEAGVYDPTEVVSGIARTTSAILKCLYTSRTLPDSPSLPPEKRSRGAISVRCYRMCG